MRKIALIPARGGSKRLPRKNIVDFQGMPIIAHTIRAALETGMFDRVCVSTEDDEISAVSRNAGAVVISRPPELATDTARMDAVIDHALDSEAAEGRRYDLLSYLYATAPLRNSDDIRAVVNLVKPEKCNFSMAVTEYDYPAYQALKMGEDGLLTPMWPEIVNKRTQEVGQLLVDNGSTYAATVDQLLTVRTFYGPGLRGHVMPRDRSVDIDLPIHLEMARFFAEKKT
jgi:CMP-N-acetylneuraminic acid synthetase